MDHNRVGHAILCIHHYILKSKYLMNDLCGTTLKPVDGWMDECMDTSAHRLLDHNRIGHASLITYQTSS